MADVKLKPGKYTVRNIAPGVRGFHDHNDGYLELDAGKTASEVVFSEGEYESAKRTGAFELEHDGDAASDDKGDDQGKALDDMTTAELQAEGVDEAAISGTGAQGKVKNSDRVAAIEAKRAAPATPPAAPSGDTLDAMGDDDLRATVAALTGSEPPADADRDTLLRLARGEA
jgi:hypothetical protein